MQATLEKTRTIKSEENVLDSLLKNLETADNRTKNEIENEIVTLGESVIPDLVNYLQVIKGTVRGVVAMVLIRMGQDSISHLNRAAQCNKDFEWMAEYLISEINCPVKAAA